MLQLVAKGILPPDDLNLFPLAPPSEVSGLSNASLAVLKRMADRLAEGLDPPQAPPPPEGEHPLHETEAEEWTGQANAHPPCPVYSWRSLAIFSPHVGMLKKS